MKALKPVIALFAALSGIGTGVDLYESQGIFDALCTAIFVSVGWAYLAYHSAVGIIACWKDRKGASQ